MLRIYFLGIIILIFAILINGIASYIGLKTWYDFLQGLSLKTPIKELLSFFDIFWLFVLYPFLLGVSCFLGDLFFERFFN